VAESGRGLPHSKTLARRLKHRCGLRKVLECASPLALWSGLAERISASSLQRPVRWPKAVEDYRSKTSRSSHAARRLAADAKERSTVPSRILALRDLRPGEELTFDYGYDIEDYRDHPCRCGASGCCGYVVAEPLRDQVRELEAGTQRRR